jgi:hypothetical protein
LVNLEIVHGQMTNGQRQQKKNKAPTSSTTCALALLPFAQMVICFPQCAPFAHIPAGMATT